MQVLLQVLKLAYRHLIGDPALALCLIYFLHIFPALDPSPDLRVASHFKT